MSQKFITLFVVDSNDTRLFTYEEPSVCPMCHYAIDPRLLSGYFVHEPMCFSCDEKYTVYILFFCMHCQRVFLAKYPAVLKRTSSTDLEAGYISHLYPAIADNTKFSEYICDLSPVFVKTYNQSQIAEAEELTEIAGGGYRRAVEFLVKDYLCHKFPEDKEAIKTELLGQAIKRIEDPRIKVLSERSTWLGNDEVHYTRKHEDFGVEDMKEFINALLHYIESELVFEKALSVPPKK